MHKSIYDFICIVFVFYLRATQLHKKEYVDWMCSSNLSHWQNDSATSI